VDAGRLELDEVEPAAGLRGGPGPGGLPAGGEVDELDEGAANVDGEVADALGFLVGEDDGGGLVGAGAGGHEGGGAVAGAGAGGLDGGAGEVEGRAQGAVPPVAGRGGGGGRGRLLVELGGRRGPPHRGRGGAGARGARPGPVGRRSPLGASARRGVSGAGRRGTVAAGGAAGRGPGVGRLLASAGEGAPQNARPAERIGDSVPVRGPRGEARHPRAGGAAMRSGGETGGSPAREAPRASVWPQ